MNAETLRQRLPKGSCETTKPTSPCLIIRFLNQSPQAQEGVDTFMAIHDLHHSFDPKSEAYVIPTDQPLPFPSEVLVDFFENMGGKIIEPQKEVE